MGFRETLFALIALHALADYPMQGEFLSSAKNRANPIAGVPWYQALGAHCAIHAGAVGLVTGSIWLALAEFTAHWLTDDAKCAGRIGFNTDQGIHIACKVIWAAVAAGIVSA